MLRQQKNVSERKLFFNNLANQFGLIRNEHERVEPLILLCASFRIFILLNIN